MRPPLRIDRPGLRVDGDRDRLRRRAIFAALGGRASAH
jgi:hypothetical protein